MSHGKSAGIFFGTGVGVKAFVSEFDLATAPPVPFDRPPTKAEVWAYMTHVYSKLMDGGELRRRAREKWAGNYVYCVNIRGWNKQPDWVEGEAVIEAACPNGPIMAGTPHVTEVERLWHIARKAANDTSQLTLEAA